MDTGDVGPPAGNQELLELEIVSRPGGTRLVPVGQHRREGIGDGCGQVLGDNPLLEQHDGGCTIDLAQPIELVARLRMEIRGGQRETQCQRETADAEWA